mgnify:CR=1 FL=1
MAAHYMEACAFTLTPTTPLRERVGLYDVVYRDGKIPAWKGGSELRSLTPFQPDPADPVDPADPALCSCLRKFMDFFNT